MLPFSLLNIILWSGADGLKPERHANSSLPKIVPSPSVSSLWGKKRKKIWGRGLPPAVELSEITVLVDLTLHS